MTYPPFYKFHTHTPGEIKHSTDLIQVTYTFVNITTILWHLLLNIKIVWTCNHEGSFLPIMKLSSETVSWVSAAHDGIVKHVHI
jgi:hypothetical protein